MPSQAKQPKEYLGFLDELRRLGILVEDAGVR